MLVLSRGAGESIHIGAVVIRVVRVKGRKVRIGIEADKEIKITRGEKHHGQRDSDNVAADTGNGNQPNSMDAMGVNDAQVD